MTCRFHEIKTTSIWRAESYFEYSFPFVGTIVIRPTWKENRDTGWDWSNFFGKRVGVDMR